MADALSRDLLEVLAKHGVGGLSKDQVSRVRELAGGGAGPVASIIKEIVGSVQDFDPTVLRQVSQLLGGLADNAKK